MVEFIHTFTIREVLDAGVQSDIDDVDERWVKALQQDILDAEVPINATLVEKQISLRDISNLQAGDVIPVDIPEVVTMTANKIPMFKAKVGQLGSSLALKIENRIGRQESFLSKAGSEVSDE